MSVLMEIIRDFKEYFDLTTKKGRIRAGAVLLFVVVGVIAFTELNKASEEEVPTDSTKTVFVSDVASLQGNSSFSIVGTVASQSQAKLQAESSGRVTSVSVSLGDTVRAGQVIATLENAAEYASVLQAEGAYDAAVAAASVGDVSVRSAQNAFTGAQNSAVTAYNNAYATLNSIFNTELDEIFVDPDRTYRDVGYRPIDFNQKEGLVDNLYNAYIKTLGNQQPAAQSEIEGQLSIALSDTEELLVLVRHLSTLIRDGERDKVQSPTAIAYLGTLGSAESRLLAAKAALEGARTSLIAAGEMLEQAQIGGTKTEVSTANAQVKQALGVLRAAQAQYANTIIRTPISGTVNELSVEVGDFVSMQDRIALVANNNALQVTAYIGENDRNRLAVGQSVRIESTKEGVITEIAPAVDSVTKKFEIKIGTDDETLTNGDTVSLTIFDTTEVAEENAPLLVPITAVKFTAQNGVIFFVEDGVLKSVPVTIGSIRGSYVEITDGLDRNAVIVVDARGLSDGQSAEAIDSK